MSIRRRKFWHRSFVALAVIFCLVGSIRVGEALAASPEIIEGAKKEGKLVWYTGMGSSEANVVAAEFQKKYPFIKAEIFRSSGEKLLTRFMIESRTQTHRADIFQASIVQVYQLLNQNLLKSYVSEERRIFPDGFKDQKGFWTAFYLVTYVIGYNTQLITEKEAPKGYEDLLQPKWRGRIGLETEEYQWFYHMLQIMGQDKGLAYMKSLAKQSPQLRNGHTLLAQLVAAGEFALTVVLYGHRVEEMIGNGAPLQWVRLRGPTITAFNAISVAENAPHPNAAKLFYDFAISKEGQQILRRFNRIPARPDVAPNPPRLTEGLNLYPARPEGMIEKYSETVAAFDKIFHQR